MKLKVAICDDDEEELIHIKNLLLKITGMAGTPTDIFSYNNSRDILGVIEQRPGAFDMLFLDMYIDEKIGFDIAKAVRRQHCKCVLVFITAFADRMAESFQYRTSAYLIKPVEEQRLQAAFQTALSHLNAVPSFCVDFKGKELAIPYDRILYFESRLKNIYLFCENENEPIVFKDKLSNLHDLPEEYFHMCHKSFIVNFSYIQKIDKIKHEAVLRGDIRLPISRFYYSDILRTFTSFHSIRR